MYGSETLDLKGGEGPVEECCGQGWAIRGFLLPLIALALGSQNLRAQRSLGDHLLHLHFFLQMG